MIILKYIAVKQKYICECMQVENVKDTYIVDLL